MANHSARPSRSPSSKFLAGALLGAPLLASAQIAVCDDDKGWPPSMYADSRTARGYTVDVLREIFNAHGMQFKVDLIPWGRCLASVEKGKEHQIVVDIGYTEDRAKRYYMTRAYYTVHYNYYYSRKLHPDGLKVQSLDELRKLRMCSILNFDPTVIGFAREMVDGGAGNYAALVGKLHLGRCDFFPFAVESAHAFRQAHMAPFDDEQLGEAPIPGMAPGRFHMAISRKYANASALHGMIERELAAMEASGRLEALWRRYLVAP